MNPTASDIATELEQAQLRTTREASRQARAAVRQEFSTLIAEVEKLLRCVGAAADPELARVRAEVESAVAAAKSVLAARVDQVRRQASDIVEVSDRYVRTRPWQAIAVAWISGVVVGLLLGRRRMNEFE